MTKTNYEYCKHYHDTTVDLLEKNYGTLNEESYYEGLGKSPLYSKDMLIMIDKHSLKMGQFLSGNLGKLTVNVGYNKAAEFIKNHFDSAFGNSTEFEQDEDQEFEQVDDRALDGERQDNIEEFNNIAIEELADAMESIFYVPNNNIVDIINKGIVDHLGGITNSLLLDEFASNTNLNLNAGLLVSEEMKASGIHAFNEDLYD